MTKKKNPAKGGSGQGNKDWKKKVLVPLVLVAMMAVPSLILSIQRQPVIKSTDAIMSQADKQGSAEFLVRSAYKRGTFDVLLKLDGEPVHCTVVVHKGLSYAMCDDPLGILIIDKEGNVQPSDS